MVLKMDSAKTKSMLNRTNPKLNGKEEEVDKGAAVPTCSIMYSIGKGGMFSVEPGEQLFETCI